MEVLVYTNVWVALAVVALCDLAFVILNKDDGHLLRFVFFATLFMYAYARWFDGPAREVDNTSRISDWTADNRWLYLTSGFIGMLGSLWFVFKLEQRVWPWLVLCAGISAFYPLRLRFDSGKALRNIAGLKLFLISAVWAIVTTILPAAQVQEPIGLELILLTLQRFFFIIAITIPFDIRDLRIDSPSLNTLPYTLGVRKARVVALSSLLIAEVAAVLFYFMGFYSIGVLVGQIFGFEIASLFIYRSTPNKPDLYFSFGVESTSIILFLAVVIFNYFWP